MKSEFAKTGNVQPTKQASTAIHREIIAAVSAFNVRNCSCITYSVYPSIRQYKLLQDRLAKRRLIRRMPILACPTCPGLPCLPRTAPVPLPKTLHSQTATRGERNSAAIGPRGHPAENCPFDRCFWRLNQLLRWHR